MKQISKTVRAAADLPDLSSNVEAGEIWCRGARAVAFIFSGTGSNFLTSATDIRLKGRRSDTSNYSPVTGGATVIGAVTTVAFSAFTLPLIVICGVTVSGAAQWNGGVLSSETALVRLSSSGGITPGLRVDAIAYYDDSISVASIDGLDVVPAVGPVF